MPTPPSSPEAPNGSTPADLSSLPAEYSAPAAARREEPRREDRAARYRKRRRRQLIGVAVLSVVLLAGVVAAIVVSQITARMKANEDPMAKNVCTSSVTPAEASSTTVNVFNMTPRPGMAGTIADEFKKRHFKVGTVGNYTGRLEMPGRASVTAVIKARSSVLPQALAVQRQLPDAVFQQDDTRKSNTVDVFLLDEVPSLNEDVKTGDGGLICK
ncbi:LytR C-terminal domain-containing protein [Falsarthrobacter nasiphocae]|uniref:LytR/CpsA/Psr regulator C-terminal domain-containing protein n=1 Tax=Falsarthrobacter nasiphocae TaxID=189863 RepID=A0AAE3YGM8_9MICC|nr:LytR C-terminal domain-containing protein [Falsarthrobacter nasiphocae]MDR6891829.1 hypothetical protein [Falsarthrobacter nasiphocae]